MLAMTDFVVGMRHDNGRTNVSTASNTARGAVSLVLGFERAPLRSVVSVKRRPICDYCTTPATRVVRGSDEPLCGGCALDHYDTAGGVRAHTLKLSIGRFALVPADEWKDDQK